MQSASNAWTSELNPFAIHFHGTLYDFRLNVTTQNREWFQLSVRWLTRDFSLLTEPASSQLSGQLTKLDNELAALAEAVPSWRAPDCSFFISGIALLWYANCCLSGSVTASDCRATFSAVMYTLKSFAFYGTICRACSLRGFRLHYYCLYRVSVPMVFCIIWKNRIECR